MAEAGRGFEVSAKHKIIGGAAMVAVLAGVAVGLLDYPWHVEVARPMRHDAERRIVVAAALASRVPSLRATGAQAVAEPIRGEAKPAASGERKGTDDRARRRRRSERQPSRDLPSTPATKRTPQDIARQASPACCVGRR